jgi:hypothetical protein
LNISPTCASTKDRAQRMPQLRPLDPVQDAQDVVGHSGHERCVMSERVGIDIAQVREAAGIQRSFVGRFNRRRPPQIVDLPHDAAPDSIDLDLQVQRPRLERVRPYVLTLPGQARNHFASRA